MDNKKQEPEITNKLPIVDDIKSNLTSPNSSSSSKKPFSRDTYKIKISKKLTVVREEESFIGGLDQDDDEIKQRKRGSNYNTYNANVFELRPFEVDEGEELHSASSRHTESALIEVKEESSDCSQDSSRRNESVQNNRHVQKSNTVHKDPSVNPSE